MKIKCNCGLKTRALGDGCEICNTRQAIDYLPTPVELARELVGEGFYEDHAAAVAKEVYQPLVSIISILSDKIDQIVREVK